MQITEYTGKSVCMDTIDLILHLRERLYVQALESYDKTLNQQYDEKVKNEYVNAIRVYQSLSEKKRQSVHFLLETVLDDTICNFLSWLDGTYFVKGQEDEVVLKIGEQCFNKNGFLSDIWKNLQDGMRREDLEEVYGG